MKIYVKCTQPIMCGTRYDKQAAKIISDSGLFDEEISNKIIEALFKEDIHAFVHAPNWLEKYLKGIARMLVEESNGSQSRAQSFLTECPDVFEKFLTYVKENRDKLGGNSFDQKFVSQMSYQDIKNFNDDLQAARDKQSAEELSTMQFSSSNFELVPIESYQQMNELFGGRLTGDGSSDKYAGGGGTAWCHTNSESTYNNWRRRGKFYVLANKDFKKIKFDPASNAENPKDIYGNSLIAILVDEKTGKLLNATLRCNHVGVSSSADNQYKTYAELSKVAGFNVEEAVLEDLGDSVEKINMVDWNQESFNIGDRITVELEGIGEAIATAVKKEGGKVLFVFDGTIGNSTMDNMDNFLSDLATKFPEPLRERLDEIRLLDASEVFSDCDAPDDWEWLLQNTEVEMENPQIPYFKPVDHRKVDYQLNGAWPRWWLRSVASPSLFAFVGIIGYADYDDASNSHGVRPAFGVW